MPSDFIAKLTIGGEEEVCRILLRQPSNFIDLLLDLQTLKVVKFWLMALESAVDVVLSLGEQLGFALQTRKKKGVDICKDEERRAEEKHYYWSNSTL